MTQSQMSNEFFLNELIEEAPLFDYTSDDIDKQALILFYLYLLEQLYDKYESKTPEYILLHFEEDVDKLLDEYNSSLEQMFNEYINKLKDEKRVEYNLSEYEPIPEREEYSLDTTKAVILVTFYALLTQLKEDSITKAQVWIDSHINDEGFSLAPNFKRAIRRVKDTFNYASVIATQKIDRNIMNYVHGDDMLYEWVCAGPSPCAWCLAQQEMPPRPLNEWEYDHINGYCILVPIVEDYYL